MKKREFEKLNDPNCDCFTYRCYYSVYDLTPYLSEGDNRITVELGDGWYRQTFRTAEGAMAFGRDLGARLDPVKKYTYYPVSVGDNGSLTLRITPKIQALHSRFFAVSETATKGGEAEIFTNSQKPLEKKAKMLYNKLNILSFITGKESVLHESDHGHAQRCGATPG